MAPCAPDCPPTRRCAAGSASGSNSVPRSFRSSIDRVGVPCVPPCWRARPMAAGALHAETKRKVAEVAELLRITAKLDNRATKLSGGEMQRVAIGRALVRQPAVYLMDEPLSSLDAKLRAELRLELKRIQQDLGATILYVTHDQIEAMTMATRIGVIEHGRLVQVDTPREIYENPVNDHVAARLGQPGINLFPRSLFHEIPAPRDAPTIGARTEHLLISKSPEAAA